MDDDAAQSKKVPGEARLRERMRNAAFAYLQRYASSRANLQRILTNKIRRWQMRDGFDLEPELAAAAVQGALEDCERLGLVDDASFASSRVASAQRKGLSRAKIGATLAIKGVDRETATAAMTAAEIDEDHSALVYARRKRLGPWRIRASSDPADDRRKDVAALCRAGFQGRLAGRVVAMTREDAEAAIDAGNSPDGFE